MVAQADPRLLPELVRGPPGAGPKGLADYQAMTSTVEYHNPIKYSSINVANYDALLLAGGHAPGMKQFLPSLNSGSDLDEPYQRALQLFQPKNVSKRV